MICTLHSILDFIVILLGLVVIIWSVVVYKKVSIKTFSEDWWFLFVLIFGGVLAVITSANCLLKL